MEATRRSFLFGIGSLVAVSAVPITAHFTPVITADVNTVTFETFDSDAFKYFIKKPSQYYFNYNEENPPKLFGDIEYTDEFAEKEAEIIKQMIGDLIKDDDTPSFLDIFMNEENASDKYTKYIDNISTNYFTDYGYNNEKEMMLDDEIKKTINQIYTNENTLTKTFYKPKENIEKLRINAHRLYEERINDKSLLNLKYLTDLPVTSYKSRFL